ncbi:MAG: hypothetical protein EOP32_03310 [Rhodococcus sp. (in: high G+C Gram-positive bacteria)]|nr:MAG: hypothetical protein EOP32_03310 [Rhodococcus sp. (in: high G+C Gram-positive bacteria)]
MTRSAADLYFRPRSIAVYGASSDPDKLSGRPLAYLKKFDYPGQVYAVNPRRDEVQGFSAYRNIADVPGPVDLAIIVVPAPAVREAVSACAQAGVGAVTIFASGFGEVGGEGQRLQDEIASLARQAGMRVVGPNCLGTFGAAERSFATFSTAFDDESERPTSPIALVTQSGAVGTFTFSTMNNSGLGVSHFANTGNEADVTVTEMLRALVDDDGVKILLGHIEGCKDLEALTELSKSAARANKPLVLLKSGRTSAGERAVAAHTGSVAGDDRDFERATVDEGATRVHSMEEMADTALAFADGRTPAGSRVTVVTLSGGAGALAADYAVSRGLTVDTWTSENDRESLAAALPYFGSVKNPIDVTGAMINELALLERTLHIVNDNAETDVVLVVMGNADNGAEQIVESLVKLRNSTTKPFFVSWTGGSGHPRTALLAAGVPTYSDPLRAVESIRKLVAFTSTTVLSHA